jgi:hypothetical protein
MFRANSQGIIELFTKKKKLSLCSQKYSIGLGSGIRDWRSGIQKKPIPDPRTRVKKGHGPGVKKAQIPDPQH